MEREKKLDNNVLDFIESIGGWSIKYWAGSRYTKSGIPDIIACINGYFFGIEDKSKNGRPTLLQLRNLEKIRDAGGYGILLYPAHFDNFKEFAKNPQKNNSWYVQNIEFQGRWKKRLQGTQKSV